MSTAPLSNLTATWNASGTTFNAIKMNVTDTASAAGSLLMDLQVNGVSQFKVSKAGAVTAVGVAIPTISSSDTLSNKTLSSPTVSGTIAGAATWSGVQTFSAAGPPVILNVASGTNYVLDLKSGGTRTGYVYSDATNFIFQGAGGVNGFQMAWATGDVIIAGTLTANGAAVPTVSSTSNLSNKTLSGVTIADATDIALATGTGTKIGTSTSQKLGFFNATPVVQPTAVADATDAASVITQLNALLTRMRNLGLIAT